MKQINHFFATLAIIIATTFSANAQSSQLFLTEFAKGLDTGLKMEMNNPEWSSIMTKAGCLYDGNDIIVTLEYTYTLQNTTQEHIDLIKDNISAENLKIAQAQNLSTTLDQNPEIKELIIDAMRDSNCDFVYDMNYVLPTGAQQIIVRLTADDISGNTISKDDLINMMLESYRNGLSMEIGKNGIVDGKVEYDGSNLVMTYVIDFDKDIINELPASEIKDAFVSEMKSNTLSISEMRQLKINNIDIIVVYTGVNGGVKSVFIDSDQF